MSSVQVETRERTELHFTVPAAPSASGPVVQSGPGVGSGLVVASGLVVGSGRTAIADSAPTPAPAPIFVERPRRIAVMGIYPNADPDLPGRVEGFFLTLGWLIFERFVALLLFVKKGELH